MHILGWARGQVNEAARGSFTKNTQVLRRESLASRATPLPQDNKSKIKSNVKSDGQECPSHTNIRQGLKPSFFFLMLIGTTGSHALPGRARIEVCGSFRHRRQRVPFDFAQGRFLTGPSAMFGDPAARLKPRPFKASTLSGAEAPLFHGGACGAWWSHQFKVKSNIKGDKSKSRATSRATDKSVRPTRGFRASLEMDSRERLSPHEHRTRWLGWVRRLGIGTPGRDEREKAELRPCPFQNGSASGPSCRLLRNAKTREQFTKTEQNIVSENLHTDKLFTQGVEALGLYLGGPFPARVAVSMFLIVAPSIEHSRRTNPHEKQFDLPFARCPIHLP